MRAGVHTHAPAHRAHPEPGTRLTSTEMVQRAASLSWATLTLVLLSYSACLAETRKSNNSALATHHPSPGTLEQCLNVDYCPLAAQCCRAGVDEYGWIAAAVGWSLWFLTLILLCVSKLMTLTPDEPKDLPA
ncbi:PREDICTED: transmembrane protein 213 [Chrysochloris asiatica]|uniref:Transmembrane protein 213 n=1 Tax=Chrysochloris asiatica TaxID=185453 RepID=A0A9B0WNF8_CHRAS|nr:PREDICTED: transmembrane protein 213 [Chrysochloris asiatica]